jgi:hypothetical protein
MDDDADAATLIAPPHLTSPHKKKKEKAFSRYST